MFVVLGLVALCGAFGCDNAENPTQVDWEKRRELRLQPQHEALTYAYLPQYSHTVSYQRHNALVSYLREETDLPVRQVFPDTFDEHIKMVGQGKIDISFSNPMVYVKIAEQYGASAFARIVESSGRAKFRGQIICRRDNKAIESLKDCRGKSWIAVDAHSAGGYLFDLGVFLRHGIRRSDFSEIAFAPGPGGKQEKVVLAVYAGKYDIGSIREGTLSVVEDAIDVDQIRVLEQTPWYPGWVYAARKDLPQKTVDKIRQALLELDPSRPEDEDILQRAGFEAVIPSSDADYKPVRELMRTIGVDSDA
ncbi:MAG: phosphate/phosphite/phosphonate ABC transporter substrate-binding protein [Thermodesulfobacteriota bacterium]